MKHIVVLDNDGETLDRYTLINTKDGEMVGASDNPFHPQGFGQYCGNVAHNYWVRAYGYGWDKCDPKTLKKRVKFGIDHFLNDCAHVGRRIKFSSLPEKVQLFAKQSFDYEIQNA